MTITDKNARHAVFNLFPQATFDMLEGQLWIRTEAWLIDSSQILLLRISGISIDSIMIEGGALTLILTQKSTKSIMS